VTTDTSTTPASVMHTKPMGRSDMLSPVPCEQPASDGKQRVNDESKTLRAAANRARVAKWRKSNPRIDYAPAADVLPVIAAVHASRPDLAKAEVIDALIRAGHKEITGSGGGDGS
jgi:hypothetical protein